MTIIVAPTLRRAQRIAARRGFPADAWLWIAPTADLGLFLADCTRLGVPITDIVDPTFVDERSAA